MSKNLYRLFPKPSGQGSTGAIDTHSSFRKRKLVKWGNGLLLLELGLGVRDSQRHLKEWTNAF